MSTGFSPGGTSRLICASLGSPNPSGATLENPVVNVYLGDWDSLGIDTPSPVMPTVVLGTNDFSYECWLAQSAGWGVHADLSLWMIGFADNPTSGLEDRYSTIVWDLAGAQTELAHFDPDGAGGTASVTADSHAIITYTSWSHHAVNVDRSANIEYFVNGTSLGTGDISGSVATSIGTREFHFLARGFDLGAVADGQTESSPRALGPIACHNRLLTGAEIVDSFRGRTVNNFGASTSHFVYNWKTIRGATGWEGNHDHFHNTFEFGGFVVGDEVVVAASGSLPYPLLAPTGTSGNVLVQDESGNDNHYILPTSTSYSTTNLAGIAFSVSNYFR